MRWIAVLSLAILMHGLAYAQETHIVKPDGTGDFPSIQAAIDAAVDGDIIILANGTFRGEGNRDINFGGKAITVRARSGNPKNCVIDAEGTPAEPHRGFLFNSEEGPGSILEGVTITGGYAPIALTVPAGGAINITGDSDPLYWTSPTIRKCRFVDNRSPFASGAVNCFFSNATIADCFFEGNIAEGYGAGAMAAAGYSSVTVERCTFVDNEAPESSGIGSGFFEGDLSVTTVTDCYFAHNLATGGDSAGDVIGAQLGASFVVSDCVFEDNYSASYAGVAGVIAGSSMSFSGCTFANNTSALGGGVFTINVGGGSFDVSSCTFYGNEAPVGSAIIVLDENSAFTSSNNIFSFGHGGSAYEGPDVATFTCTDIYGNEGGDWTGVIADQLGVDGNIALDPEFVNAKKGKFILKEFSPCAPFTPPNESCDLIGAWPVEERKGDGIAAGNECNLRMRRAESATILSAGVGSIRYALSEPSHVRMGIYDATGRLVRHLVDTTVQAGEHRVRWDGCDDAGRKLTSGIYYSRLTAGAEAATRDSRKLLILK